MWCPTTPRAHLSALLQDFDDRQKRTLETFSGSQAKLELKFVVESLNTSSTLPREKASSANAGSKSGGGLELSLRASSTIRCRVRQKSSPIMGPTLLSPTTTFNRPLVNQIGGAPITIGREPCGRRGVLLGILEKFLWKQFIESIPDVFCRKDVIVSLSILVT